MSEFAYGGVRLEGTALYRKARLKSRGEAALDGEVALEMSHRPIAEASSGNLLA
jgi:hypothetical protein